MTVVQLDSAIRDRDESEASLKAQRDRISNMRIEIETLKDAAASASNAGKTSQEDKYVFEIECCQQVFPVTYAILQGSH